MTIEGSNDFLDDGDDANTFSNRDERCCSCITRLDDYFFTVPCFNGYTQVRRNVWEVVSGRSSKYGSVTRYWPSLMFEMVIFLLIVTNVILSILISEESYALDPEFVATYGTIEIVSTIVFTVEYSLRLWTAPSGRDKHSSKRSTRRREVVNLQHGCCSSRLRWSLAPLSLLDLLVLIGFYVDYLSTSGAKQGLTAVRLFRLLSIFRFERQSKGLKHLGQVLKRKIPELVLAFFVAIILLVTSATIMYAVENEYPSFNSLSKSLWWSAMTITTVGYGDVSPNTGVGKIIASFVAFMGLCLFALPSAVLGSGLIEVMTEQRHAAFVERKKARRNRRRRYSHQSNSSGGGGGGGGGGGLGPNGNGGGGGGVAGQGGGRSGGHERKSTSSSLNGVEMSSINGSSSSSSSGRMDHSPNNSSKLLFSDIFDVHNAVHLAAVSRLLMDDPSVLSYFDRFKPEPCGLMGLHTVVARRLAEEYLHEHLEEEDEEEELLGRGGGGGGRGGHYLSPPPMNNVGEDKFMKL